jgi:tetratricopeptide (TPR) repeat protein
VLALAGILVAGCGSDYDKGVKALAKKDYSQAISLFENFLVKEKENLAAKEGLVKAYAFKARETFASQEKYAKNLIKKAEEQFVPEMSQETKDALCDYFVVEAAALVAAGKDNKALERLDHASTAYGPNQKVTDEFNKHKTGYAQHMFQQGKDKYDEGVKAKDDFKLISAESFLTYALKYDPNNAAAKKLASTVRAKTLAMANPDENIPFAVTNVKRNPKVAVLAVYIKSNHATIQLDTDPGNFILVDVAGKEYPVDPVETKKFKALATKTLKSGEEAEGVIAYTLDKSVGIQKLIYRDGQNSVEKYFP